MGLAEPSPLAATDCGWTEDRQQLAERPSLQTDGQQPHEQTGIQERQGSGECY